MAASGKIERQIVRALIENDFILTFHAERERMPQRSVRRADIVECGRTAENVSFDSKRGTYRVLGLDLDGDDLTVVVGIDRGVVVVTVF